MVSPAADRKRPRAIEGVIRRMRAIVRELPPGDGIAAFTRLYLAVTEAVSVSAQARQFENEPFLRTLDVAFANAGIDSGAGFVAGWAGGERPRVEEGALERYTDGRWNRVIDVNLTGIFATARAAARHMRPRGYGRIVVTTSLASTKVEPVIGSAYMAAKAGARHLVRCLALELAAYGITANAIAPGFFVTNIGGGHAHDPELQAMVAKDVPMHRVGRPDDVKALALFLAAPASEYVTGQEIVIDGGWGLGIAD